MMESLRPILGLPSKTKKDKIALLKEALHVESCQEAAKKDAEAQAPETPEKNPPPAQESVSPFRARLSDRIWRETLYATG